MRGQDRFEQVITQVHAISQNHYDETLPVIDMEFESLDRMWISGRDVEVLPSAQKLIANRLRVPHSYLARCPEDLQARNLNYWIQEEAKNRDNLFCRFNGNKLRAVFTDRYTALDHMEVLSKMLEYGFNADAEVHYYLDETMMVVKVPDYARRFGFNGDGIVPGISIANSEVGVLAFSIEAYFFRLVCSNGLIATTAVSSKFKHISRKGFDEFPSVMGQVVHEAERSRGRLLISMETPVDNPTSSMAAFNRQFQVNKSQAEAVEYAYYNEPGNTMYHLINAYTGGAHAPNLSVEEAYHLERVGGLILAMVKH